MAGSGDDCASPWGVAWRLMHGWKEQFVAFENVTFMIGGLTDLCHPILDTRFEKRVPIGPIAEAMQTERNQKAFLLFYLNQYMRSDHVHKCFRHTADGRCLHREMGSGLLKLDAVAAALFLTLILWLNNLITSGQEFAPHICIMCKSGKHRSVYVGRLLVIAFRLMLRQLDLRINVIYDWAAMDRIRGEVDPQVGPWWKKIEDYRQPDVLQKKVIYDACSWACHMLEAFQGGLQFFHVECTDDAFEAATRPRRVQSATFRLQSQTPSITDFLYGLKTSLGRGKVVEFMPREMNFQLCEAAASSAFWLAWREFTQEWMLRIWPEQCSLCRLLSNPPVGFRFAADFWEVCAEGGFGEYIPTEAVAAEEEERIRSQDMARRRPPPPPPPPPPPRRRRWASVSPDKSESESDDQRRAPVLAASSATRAAERPRSPVLATGRQAAAAGRNPRAPVLATGRRRPATAAPGRAAQKRVRFDDSVTERPVEARSRVVQVSACYAIGFLSEWSSPDLAESEMSDMTLVIDTADSHAAGGRKRKFVVQSIEASATQHDDFNDYVAHDAAFAEELEILQKLLLATELPFTGETLSFGQKTQLFLFLHMMCVATQSFEFVATARFFAGLGRYCRDGRPDWMELMYFYVYIVYLCRNADEHDWNDHRLNIFCIDGDAERSWWAEQQFSMQCVDGRLFSQEYACLVACPLENPTGLKAEMTKVRQRLFLAEIPVLPPVPDAKYWYRHDAAVLAGDALTPARVLPVFRATARSVEAVWGGNDGERQNVSRATVISDTNCMLSASIRLPRKCKYTLADFLSCQVAESFLAAHIEQGLNRPDWLLSRGAPGCTAGAAWATDDQAWMPQVSFQCLGNDMLSTLRPDNVFHPHLRCHVEFHIGLLLAQEIKLSRLTNTLVEDFLEGCGLYLHGGTEAEWVSEAIEALRLGRATVLSASACQHKRDCAVRLVAMAVIHIRVRNLSGEVFDFDLEHDAPLSELHRLVVERAPPPPGARAVLQAGDRVLPLNRSLGAEGITEEIADISYVLVPVSLWNAWLVASDSDTTIDDEEVQGITAMHRVFPRDVDGQSVHKRLLLPTSLLEVSLPMRPINFEHLIDSLPANVRSLTFHANCTQPCGVLRWPKKVEEMYFEDNFTQSLEAMPLPEFLRVLSIRGYYNQSLANVYFPSTLDTFILQPHYAVSLERAVLPETLRVLHLGGSFSTHLLPKQLPRNLHELTFNCRFDSPVVHLVFPDGLVELTLAGSFNDCMNAVSLPRGLQRLTFGKYYSQESSDWRPPQDLRELRYGDRYNFPLPQGLLPQSLRVLVFGKSFNQDMRSTTLPDSLEALEFGTDFDFVRNFGHCGPRWPERLRRLQVDDAHVAPAMSVHCLLPKTLTELIMGPFFDLPSQGEALPPRLEQLTFGLYFNRSLQGFIWPLLLETINFGLSYNQSIAGVQWPQRLRILRFGEQFNQPLEGVVWPPCLQHLSFGLCFNQPIAKGTLPETLETLVFGDHFNQDLRRCTLPDTLVRLDLGANFYLQLHPVCWPPRLEDLRINQPFPMKEQVRKIALPTTLRYLQFRTASMASR
eukprot:s590_g6.t1